MLTDFLLSFLQAMAFRHVNQETRHVFYPQNQEKHGLTKENHFIAYTPHTYYGLTTARYTIPKNFALPFNSTKRYLRLGVVQAGVSNYALENKSLSTFSPSPFLVMEDGASGRQSWKKGSLYEGTEIIIDLEPFQQAFGARYPEIEDLSKLRDNFSYYCLPLEVIHILNELKRLAWENTLTPLHLESAVLRCLSFIIRELKAPAGGTFGCQYDYSVSSLGCDRTIRLNQDDLDAVEHAQRILEDTLQDPPTIRTLSKKLFISEQKLTCGFKKKFGMTIGAYITQQRLLLAARLLSTTDLPVGDIARQAGYAHTSNFAKAFRRKYEKTPLQFRKAEH